MPPLKVAHVITGLETGGAEMMLLRLLAGTDRARWHPSVVSLRDRGTLGVQIEQMGVRVTPLGVRRSLPGPRAVWHLMQELRRFEPCVVQGWMYHGNLAALTGRMLALRRVPVVWNIRYVLNKYRLERPVTAGVARLGALLSSRAARIIYNSRASARQHAELGYATTGTVIIPNGFDTETFAPSAAARARFRQRLGVSEDTVLIGRVGRYHPMKDYGTFLAAARLLSAQGAAVRFVLAGKGVDQGNLELAELAGRFGLGNRAYLLGEVQSMNELMAGLDILCSSSAYGESFPSVLGEAMACGVPCVTTDVGDSAWIVGRTGLVLPPGDPAALAAACRALIDAGAERRRRLGSEARARVFQEFSLHEVVSQYAGVYMDVLNSRGAQ